MLPEKGIQDHAHVEYFEWEMEFQACKHGLWIEVPLDTF